MAASSASLSLRPSSSLSFVSDRPYLLIPSSTSASSCSSSSSSFLFLGTHQSFISLYSCSPSSTKFNSRVSAKRGFGPVITASGDYYATLGVPKSASGKEIKAAYRRLARQVVMNFIFFFFLGFWNFSLWYSIVDCQCKEKMKKTTIRESAKINFETVIERKQVKKKMGIIL